MDDPKTPIETKLELLAQAVRLNGRQTRRCVRKLSRTLEGDGIRPGLVTKVDRLQQAESRRKWQLRALWGALMTVAGKLASDLFSTARAP